MKIKVILLMLFALLVTSVFAEISNKRAAIQSLILPGFTQFQHKKNGKGLFFASNEMVLIFSYFRANMEAKNIKDNYTKQAKIYANATGSLNDERLHIIKNYRSITDYNNEIIQKARNYYLIYQYDEDKYNEYVQTHIIDADEFSWHWNTEKNWNKYQDTWRKKNKYEMYAKLAFGISLANRIISAIDAIYINRHSTISSELKKISITPDLKRNAILMGYNYDF